MRFCRTTVGALLLGMLGGCAGQAPTAPPVAFARAPEPLPTPAATAVVPAVAEPAKASPQVAATFFATEPVRPNEAVAPAVEADDDQDFERRLRHELATAADPTTAAIELAALLAGAERHDEALAVVAAAQARKAGNDLRILRAGLLRDLGQRHAAVGELRAVRREVGAERLHPNLLFELAELEVLEGDRAAAEATLQELAGVHEGDPWLQTHGAARQALATQIASGKPAVMKVRDVLGNLRGAPFADDRLQALDKLLHAGQGAGLDDELQQLAVVVALGDPAEAVRARAVERADPAPDHRADFLAAAFDDPAALVRQRAVARAVAWRTEGTTPLLLAQLDREADAATFVVLCDALRQFAPDLPRPSYATASSPSGRSAVATDYRRRLAP